MQTRDINMESNEKSTSAMTTETQRSESIPSGEDRVRHSAVVGTSQSDLEKGPKEESVKDDSNIVDFEGPDDPENAQNWSTRTKWNMIACLAAMTFVTPLASSMFAPGVPYVLRDFETDSEILGSFVVSVFVLGYAAGPIVIAPLSEMYGRMPVYHTTNIVFVIFSIACALSKNIGMLIAFRFLAGFAGSAAITMGGGTIGDCFRQEERGGAMAIWSLGPLMGPVIGPIAGGFISESIGWRWVFWIISMASGVVAISFVLFLRETYAPAILRRKTKRLIMETGNISLRPAGTTGEPPRQLWAKALVRPMKMLVLSPIIGLLSLYCAICYGYLYLLFTTITGVFEGDYGFSSGVVGLTYIGIGVGMFSGTVIVGATSDRLLKKKAAGGEMKPEYRLPFMIPGAFAIPMGLFIYGWTAQYHVFWFVPIFGTAFVGFGLIGIFMATNTYLVDAFQRHAASALAANAILRSLFGALLPLAGPAMYSKLGLGWGNSLLGFIAVALIFIPFGFLRYGEYLRTSPRFQISL